MRYLLTFKPLKNFFFGNNLTLSRDFFAQSDYFPQNTQLLGAIRLYIAEQNDKMKQYLNGSWCNDPEGLKKLTGKAKSFDKEKKFEFEKNSDLGKINNLSSMFIVKEDLTDAYFKTPFDIKISDEISIYELAKINEQYYLKDYNAKNFSEQALGNSNFWDSYLNGKPISKGSIVAFDKVYKKHQQVGIALNNKHIIEEQFYTKIDYNLKEGYVFGAIIDLQEPIIKDGVIQIGAESSLFELKVKKIDELAEIKEHTVIKKLFTKPQNANKVVAISEVMQNPNIDTKFQIAPYKKEFALLKKDKSKVKGRFKEKNLIPSGSVFYLKNELPQFNIGAYEKMGYNQFLKIN